MNYPYDLAVGPHGQIVVAEYGANRIQIFSPEGASLGAIGGPGSAPGEFASPWGVAVDRDGAIWVADTLNHRMQALRIAWP
ncbi:MAG: NHL repeat protein [candidate division BRC1 bacterium ADurb.BinA364]|nr:MAG: NHL repeat protein [candidate division BRC1 bacterium ADurb.BinA364]